MIELASSVSNAKSACQAHKQTVIFSSFLHRHFLCLILRLGVQMEDEKKSEIDGFSVWC